MVSELRDKRIGTNPTAFSITLVSLSTGVGRVSAEIENSNSMPAAWISVELTSGGTGPTADTNYLIYLVKSDSDATDPIRSDDADGTDKAYTVENGILLGSITVTNTASKQFRNLFDTWDVVSSIGEHWSIAIVNETGQDLSTTEADSFIRYRYHLGENQ